MQLVFDFFNDWAIMDIELINERMRVAQFAESPWGILERFVKSPPSDAELKVIAREINNRNRID